MERARLAKKHTFLVKALICAGIGGVITEMTPVDTDILLLSSQTVLGCIMIFLLQQTELQNQEEFTSVINFNEYRGF